MADPHRHTDESFLEYTREQKCAVCLEGPPNDPHHMVTRGASGGDRTALPLCRDCHRHLHDQGLRAFEQERKVNLWKQAHRHLRRYATNRLE